MISFLSALDHQKRVLCVHRSSLACNRFLHHRQPKHSVKITFWWFFSPHNLVQFHSGVYELLAGGSFGGGGSTGGFSSNNSYRGGRGGGTGSFAGQKRKSDISNNTASTRRPRRCGSCGEEGHTKRACPHKEGSNRRMLGVVKPCERLTTDMVLFAKDSPNIVVAWATDRWCVHLCTGRLEYYVQDWQCDCLSHWLLMCSLVYNRVVGVLCTRLTARVMDAWATDCWCVHLCTGRLEYYVQGSVWLPEQLTADVFTCVQGGWRPVYKTDSLSIAVAWATACRCVFLCTGRLESYVQDWQPDCMWVPEQLTADVFTCV